MQSQSPSPQGFWNSRLAYGKAIIMSLCVFVPLFIINVFQALSLMIKPFSLRGFRRINRFFADRYWSSLAWLLVNLYGVQIDWQGDEDLRAEDNALLIANHQSGADVLLLLALGRRWRRAGDMKFFVKEVFKYIPGPGWGMWFLDCLFLKRRWHADRRRIAAVFQRYRDEQTPLWLTLFPEGTRFSAKKRLESHKTAKHYQLPLCQHVLVPHAKGFETSINALSEHLQAVYDITLAYPEGVPSIWNLLRGDVKRVIIKTQRFPLAAIPKDYESAQRWLCDRFVEKDRFLAQVLAETYATKEAATSLAPQPV